MSSNMDTAPIERDAGPNFRGRQKTSLIMTTTSYSLDEVQQQAPTVDTVSTSRAHTTLEVHDDDDASDIDMRGLLMLSILRFSS
jgi:hypothetical protein